MFQCVTLLFIVMTEQLNLNYSLFNNSNFKKEAESLSSRSVQSFNHRTFPS